jgi:hypothetical protein
MAINIRNGVVDLRSGPEEGSGYVQSCRKASGLSEEVIDRPMRLQLDDLSSTILVFQC